MSCDAHGGLFFSRGWLPYCAVHSNTKYVFYLCLIFRLPSPHPHAGHCHRQGKGKRLIRDMYKQCVSNKEYIPEQVMRTGAKLLVAIALVAVIGSVVKLVHTTTSTAATIGTSNGLAGAGAHIAVKHAAKDTAPAVTIAQSLESKGVKTWYAVPFQPARMLVHHCYQCYFLPLHASLLMLLQTFLTPHL